MFPLLNPNSFLFTNFYNLLHVSAKLLAALSNGTKIKLPCNSFNHYVPVLPSYRNLSIDLQSKLLVSI